MSTGFGKSVSNLNLVLDGCGNFYVAIGGSEIGDESTIIRSF
jgi:hypothetical protein